MKYKLNPVIIDAIQWDGTAVVFNQIKSMANSSPVPVSVQCVASDKSIFIQFLSGTLVAQIGDFVVRGVMGEIYPVKPNIFAIMATKAE